MTKFLVFFATLVTVAPVSAKPALARVAVCEALMRVTPARSGHDPRVALDEALHLIGDGPAVSAEAAVFDVDTTLKRIRRLPDGLSHHSAAVARLIQINLDLADQNVLTMVNEVGGRDAIADEMPKAVARANATDAAVNAELAQLYPPDRGAARWLRWTGALALVPPAALATAGYPLAAVLATPMLLVPPAALHLLLSTFNRAAVQTTGLTTHAAAVAHALDQPGPAFVMHSGSLRVPVRVSRALSDGRAPDLRDMAIISEDGVRLPFEARQAPTDVEMREVLYDSIFVRSDGGEPKWILVLRTLKIAPRR